MAGTPFDLQLLNLCAALLLLLSFAMLAQRRIVTLVNLLAVQGALLFVATLLLAWRTGEHHLYLSAALTLALKVVFLPWLLHRLIRHVYNWRRRLLRCYVALAFRGSYCQMRHNLGLSNNHTC